MSKTPRMVKTSEGRRNYSLKKNSEREYLEIKSTRKNFTPKF